LFKIAIEWVSLWHFRVYMYYNSNWLISSIFLLVRNKCLRLPVYVLLL
jgi:hypothetical protein